MAAGHILKGGMGMLRFVCAVATIGGGAVMVFAAIFGSSFDHAAEAVFLGFIGVCTVASGAWSIMPDEPGHG